MARQIRGRLICRSRATIPLVLSNFKALVQRNPSRRDRIDVEGCARKSGSVGPPDRAVPVRAWALPMAFFARGTDWLKKITKQSQFGHKLNRSNNLIYNSDAEERSRRLRCYVHQADCRGRTVVPTTFAANHRTEPCPSGRGPAARTGHSRARQGAGQRREPDGAVPVRPRALPMAFFAPGTRLTEENYQTKPIGR